MTSHNDINFRQQIIFWYSEAKLNNIDMINYSIPSDEKKNQAILKILIAKLMNRTIRPHIGDSMTHPLQTWYPAPLVSKIVLSSHVNCVLDVKVVAQYSSSLKSPQSLLPSHTLLDGMQPAVDVKSAK